MFKHSYSTASILALCSALLLSSCATTNSNQFGAVATGASLGGMFGSSIGGLMGGPRGADKGTIAGMVIGGAIGAATTAQKKKGKAPTIKDYNYEADDAYNGTGKNSDVQYGTYNSPQYQSPYAQHSEVMDLEVSNIHFLDDNNNQRLDNNEKAFIVFDIRNTSSKTLYNITPNLTCNSKRIVISAPATVASLLPGQAIRYKASVIAVRRLKQPHVQFSISFGQGKQTVVAKTFEI